MIWRQGERVHLGALQVTKVSHYQAPNWSKDGEETKYRYVFKTPTGESMVYSGRYYGFHVGEFVDLDATIKRVEHEYHCVRLSRLAVKARYKERQRGLL